jgi:methionine-S-sulfoxide reductase
MEFFLRREPILAVFLLRPKAKKVLKGGPMRPSLKSDKKSLEPFDLKGELATFAAGCFWGVEEIFRALPGVLDTTVGYIGGSAHDAIYQKVATGETDHAEAVEIRFDPAQITYENLVDYFWRLHDPTQVNRQGVDIGPQYRSAIFYHSDEQRIIAEASRRRFDESRVFANPAATLIVPATEFYAAEDYHQDYFQRNGGHICHILRDK